MANPKCRDCRYVLELWSGNTMGSLREYYAEETFNREYRSKYMYEYQKAYRMRKRNEL